MNLSYTTIVKNTVAVFKDKLVSINLVSDDPLRS